MLVFNSTDTASEYSLLDIDVTLKEGQEKRPQGSGSRIVRISVRLAKNNALSLGAVLRALEKKGNSLNASTIYCCNPKKNFQYYCSVEEADQYFLPLNELGGELELECKDTELTKPKRVKERNIREIVNKVAEWRKLYMGKADNNGIIKKYTLEEAAEKVGIAKKTLDDYLLQIRAGKKLSLIHICRCRRAI
eukprot:TRINITY_DN5424_c0_g1_i10.p1 TRINITY_DN5424_c0_g1~~TRINITY_DN5424_c0_g1_i10.p1  ORF type:complete len:192 (+),score=62.32 TRINITY_DN5424_c0_g1_i10:147-722(+)